MKGPSEWPGRVAIGLGMLMVTATVILIALSAAWGLTMDLSTLVLLLPLVTGAWSIWGGRKMIQQAKEEHRLRLWMDQASKAWLS